MAYTYRLHSKADEDYTAAYSWYEDKQEGLGEKFIIAVREKIEAIASQPEIYGSKEKKEYREALVKGFPYIIVYKIYKAKKKYLSALFITLRNIQRINTESNS